MTKKYATATAFRRALEERLKNRSRKTGIELQRLRRQVVFDRLLFRLFSFFPKDLLLKGGYAMELRLESARTTKDIDLVLKTTALSSRTNQDRVIQKKLQDAVEKDSGDFFTFLVGEQTLDLEAIPYGGSRYPIDALLDNRLFARFPIDVVVSSLFLEPIEQIEGQDWLSFAGIEKMPFPVISKEQQFAEKLHSYSLPREESENSRVKDLVDLALLITLGGLRIEILKEAIQKVFEYRDTHPVPESLNTPPEKWVPKFNRLAKECGLEWSQEKTYEKLRSFFAQAKNS